MAKKPSPPSKPGSGANPSFRGFININLRDEDKAAIKEHDFTPSDFVSSLDAFIDEGYKFTFSYDDYNHCFQCIGTRSDKEHPDYGVLLSGRGSTALKAFKQWSYILRVLLGESSWGDWLKPNNRYEIDD